MLPSCAISLRWTGHSCMNVPRHWSAPPFILNRPVVDENRQVVVEVHGFYA